MYDDKLGDLPAGDMPDFGPMDSSKGSWTHKIFSKAETIIPIILVILFLLFFSISFLNVNPNSIPLVGGFLGNFFGDSYTRILIIGEPTDNTLNLFNSPDWVQIYRVTTRSTEDFQRNSLETLKNYDVVIIDQTLSADKTIPTALATSLRDYVTMGGSFVIVADSAYGLTSHPDSFGWVTALGSTLAPVDCQSSLRDITPCEKPMRLKSRLTNNDYGAGKKIFEGITYFPATPSLGEGIMLTTFAITPRGDEWMAIQSVGGTKRTYPGIVYKSAGLGKVVYFNYNEIWQTPEILKRVLNYLK